MKFIHISDLHIGKRVNERSLIDEQTHILNQICDITDAQRPDAVLIAGDVYDKAVPSGEAVLLFDDFLTRISSLCGHIFIISGNPDSAERMAFGTDYPVWDPVREMDLFLALDLTDDQKEQIAWKTASRFLKL